MNLLDAPTVERQSMEAFKVFAGALPCIVWTADARGKVEWCSQEFHDYTGLSLEATANWGWMPSVHVDDHQSVSRGWALALKSGAQLDSVVRLRGVAGTYRWFKVRARPLHGQNGAIKKWFGTLTDSHDRQIMLEANTHVADALIKGYLSKPLPKGHGLKFDRLYRASNILEKLGGDWYDVFELPDGRVAFSLGDVCGHGIDAAVKMAEAKQAIFVSACLDDPAPESVLRHANSVIFLNGRTVSITTALYGIIDTEERTVTYASAGHHPPLFSWANGQTKVLPNHGFPLGVEKTMPNALRTHTITYESGSMMVLYTDGLIEFNHDLFDGEARLLVATADAVRRKAEHPAEYIANHVLGDVQSPDDVAILTILFED